MVFYLADIRWLDFGLFRIETYRFFAYLAFVVGTIISYKIARSKKLNLKHLFTMIILIVVGVIVGARAFYYFGPWTWHMDWSIWTRFFKFIQFWGSGLVLYGGMVGALIALWIYKKITKVNLWKYLDLFTFSYGIGLFIYRFGCFLANDSCRGKATSLFWGVIRDKPKGVAIHPSPIYASLNGLLLYGYAKLIEKKSKFDGYVFLWGLVYYSITRFLIEFTRSYKTLVFGISPSQVVSIVMLLIAGFLLYTKYKKVNHNKD